MGAWGKDGDWSALPHLSTVETVITMVVSQTGRIGRE
jgi:hypothetical protein